MRSVITGYRRLVSGGLAVVMGCVMAASPGLAAAKAKAKPQLCASDRELTALNTRVLQTELMVAALSCNEKTRYNTFVNTYQSLLTSQGQTLQALFKRVHGGQSSTRLNAFITKLANDSSQQVRARADDYCVFAVELFDETMASSPRDWGRLAGKPWIVSRHGFQPCVAQASGKPTG